MLVNFEEITHDLTDVEKSFASDIERYLKIVLSQKPIIQSELVKQINSILNNERGPTFKITTVRLRKYFNYFRTNSILPIIATSEGCYLTQNKSLIAMQILSMQQRANSINKAAEGLKKFLG